jgi:diguanylate cyclase (GGDEF)-like protein
VVIRAVDQEEPTLAPRSTKDRALKGWLDERGMRDAIVVPVAATDDQRGTLTVVDRLGETATFTADDLALLQTLTGHLAVALRNTALIERLGYEATHDSLTGLANRSLLTQHIQLALDLSPDRIGVVLLDLNRFKEVNDALGHDVGDRLLQVVGDRLRQAIPAEATVARLGGDEFAVLLPNLPHGDDGILAVTNQLAAALAQPIHFDEAILTPEASIGVAVSATTGTDLLRQADTAMYAAKHNDQQLAVYHPDMDRGRVERLALLADLRLMLESNPEQVVVHYQPKVDMARGGTSSVEALVRWNHPTLGVLPPDRFIPLAESTGLIERLTQHVLDTALADCAAWIGHGHDVSVAVNLSARNIGDPDLPRRITQALERAHVPAGKLILEITESSVMGEPEATIPVLQALADLGVAVSLDDFGTGYSSLSYLQRLPVNEVKIDRSFVIGLAAPDPTNSRALIRSITGLGANLALRIVAEGVETAEQLDELHSLGCHLAQGYYISRPLPAADLARWLEQACDTSAPRLSLVRPGL